MNKISKFLPLAILFFLTLSSIRCDAKEDIVLDETEDDREYKSELEFKSENLVTIVVKNYTEVLEKSKPILVLFYAPWCGHCQAFAPEYSKIADKFSKDNSNLTVAIMDATENQEFSMKLGIEGFPTLRLFEGNETYEYEGERSMESIGRFVNKKLFGGVEELKSLKDIEEYTKTRQFVFLATFDKEAHKDKMEKYNDISKMIDKIDFVICSAKACVEHYKNELVFLRPFDE